MRSHHPLMTLAEEEERKDVKRNTNQMMILMATLSSTRKERNIIRVENVLTPKERNDDLISKL